MASESAKRLVNGFLKTVAAVGGFVFGLQLLPDLRSEDEKYLQNYIDDIAIRKALAERRELKRNGKKLGFQISYLTMPRMFSSYLS